MLHIKGFSKGNLAVLLILVFIFFGTYQIFGQEIRLRVCIEKTGCRDSGFINTNRKDTEKKPKRLLEFGEFDVLHDEDANVYQLLDLENCDVPLGLKELKFKKDEINNRCLYRSFSNPGTIRRRKGLRPSPNWVLHSLVLGITGVAMLQAKNSADRYNHLSKKNKELAENYASSADPSIETEFNDNRGKMKKYKSEGQLWDLVTLIGLGIEAYLVLSSSFSDSVSQNPAEGFQIAINSQHLKMNWGWSF